MTITPINRTKGVLLSAHSPHGITSSIKTLKMVTKKLKLKNQEILLVETFLVHNSRTKIFPDMLFSQNDSPEQD